MSIQRSGVTSRRAVLAAATGGAAALLVDSIARPLPARAHDIDDVLLGGLNESSSTTALRNVSGPGTVLSVESVHGSAIDASSGEGPAIRAVTDTAGAISAVSKHLIGVIGYGGEPDDSEGGSNGGPATTGVMGRSGAGYGLCGMSTIGEGVHAECKDGQAIYARSVHGMGLDANSDFGVAVRAIGFSGTAVDAHASGSDPEIAGVNAAHAEGDAVRGWSKMTGLRGITEGTFDWDANRDVVGVLGISRNAEGHGGDGIGVEGRSDTGMGVLGGGLIGVHGASGSPGGTGVFAKRETGPALEAFAVYPDKGARAIVANGPVEFSSAGRGSIDMGASRATVKSPVPLKAADSKILVTLLADPAGKKASSFSHVVIHEARQAFSVVLTAPAARAVPFAYFVLD